jgi:hypothetical protein
MGIVKSVNLSMLLPKSPMLNRYCNETPSPSTIPLPQSLAFASRTTRHLPQFPASVRPIAGMANRQMSMQLPAARLIRSRQEWQDFSG